MSSELLPRICVVSLATCAALCSACARENPAFGASDSVAGGSETGKPTASGAEEDTQGPGDGDGDEPGDGDGDGPGDGDGDEPGDGDGDGDGDEPGDGDGDEPPACEAPEVACGDECVDIFANDDEHCGACFADCETGCLEGQCFADPYHLVFVTSETFIGAMGGLEGADDRCSEAVVDAELEGIFLPWLSTGELSAAERMEPFDGDYRLVDGTLVANSWSDLTDGTLLHPIDLDEYGEAPPEVLVCVGAEVWTNTKIDGTSHTFNDCEGWTSAAIGATSSTGWWDQTNHEWTASPCLPVTCATPLPIYCIQQ